MSLGVGRIAELQRRRKRSLDMAGPLAERSIGDAIERMKRSPRLERLRSSYPTIGMFLSADLGDLVMIPGVSTTTVDAIQDAIDQISIETSAEASRTPPSVGERMLVEVSRVLQSDEASTFDVMLRNGSVVEWVIGIRIEDGIAFLHSGQARTKGRDHTHVVDAGEVVMARRADGENAVDARILAWASKVVHDRNEKRTITITLRGGTRITGIDMVEHDGDLVQISVVGRHDVSHCVSARDVIGVEIDGNMPKGTRTRVGIET